MKAALQKSVKDAQIRDSFNKESMALVKSDAWFELVSQLNKLERVLPRNASKLHTCLIMNKAGEVYLLNFEVLEVATSGFRISQIDEEIDSIKSDVKCEVIKENEESQMEGGEEND